MLCACLFLKSDAFVQNGFMCVYCDEKSLGKPLFHILNNRLMVRGELRVRYQNEASGSMACYSGVFLWWSWKLTLKIIVAETQ